MDNIAPENRETAPGVGPDIGDRMLTLGEVQKGEAVAGEAAAEVSFDDDPKKVLQRGDVAIVVRRRW